MRNRILLGLDNGNKCTKTSEGYISESGFTKSNTEPISSSNLLIYEGKFYSIGGQRLSVQMDKTVNQDAFILSLTAIADAISKAGIEGEVDVILGVGLPIVSYGTNKKKFREYFLRRNINFNFNKKDYYINIIDRRVYPQGYSSLITVFNSYRNLLCNVIDIGGYTIDFFRVENGIIDVSLCYSLPNGIITLIANIQQELLKANIRLTETQIQDIIAGKEPVLFEADIKEVIKVMSEEYVENILAKIQEYGFEFHNPTVFTGGGIFNMLPVYPLDGSQIFIIVFFKLIGSTRTFKLIKKLSITIKVLLAATGLIQAVFFCNPSILIAALFLPTTKVLEEKMRIMKLEYLLHRKQRILKKKIYEARHIVAMDDCTLGEVIKRLDYDRFHIIYVINKDMEIIGVTNEQQLIKMIQISGEILKLSDIITQRDIAQFQQ